MGSLIEEVQAFHAVYTHQVTIRLNRVTSRKQTMNTQPQNHINQTNPTKMAHQQVGLTNRTKSNETVNEQC